MKLAVQNLRRSAFTLTELILVIAIITILAALGSWGVISMVTVQHKRNTENTIRVVNKLMQDRWKAVVDEAKRETPSAAVLALADGDTERAKVIWAKVRLMEAFPTRYAEVTTPTVLDAWILPDQKYKPHFARYQSALAGKSGGAGESSACLLLVLKTLQSDGVALDDQIRYAVSDTDGDGVPELIDGWSKPMLFTRFAVGATNPASAGSRAAKFADPMDPTGTLLNPVWYTSITEILPGKSMRQTFEESFQYAISPDNGANANYVIPSIVSMGPDGGLGTADDIINYKLRGD